MEELVALPALEQLNLYDCQQLVGTRAAHLHRLKRLKWLNVGGCKLKPHKTRALRKALPPQSRPGRPQRADVTEALRLEAEGVARKAIYCRLGKATRDEQHALREAMRQRKARKRRRDNSGAVTPT